MSFCEGNLLGMVCLLQNMVYIRVRQPQSWGARDVPGFCSTQTHKYITVLSGLMNPCDCVLEVLRLRLFRLRLLIILKTS
uniref:Uncharacterized protein n=1 Tax=Anguilla anguilla TaxID=7936 RepID=A0A0E9X0V4_ANGAN